MQLALSSAAAWFFVSSSRTLDGTRGVRLVEGIKALSLRNRCAAAPFYRR
jgi:hypothetical protein